MKNNFTNSILLLFTILSAVLAAQNETKKWYFGTNAGLDFMTLPPTILTNGALSTLKSSSSISDASGNLLFYTNGVTIWNKQHLPMANGTGLLGDPSATSSGWTVQQPGSAHLYYVFTLDKLGQANGLRYSIVDMSLAAGMGSVTAKNVLLHTPSSEKLAITRHCNGTDLWIVSHDFNSNIFRSFLLTTTGISTNIITSGTGTYIGNTALSSAGQMKISPNGKKLALAIYSNPSAFELYDFDNTTGTVSNYRSMVIPGSISSFPGGVEFSPDCSKLYGCHSDGAMLYQWDLCALPPAPTPAMPIYTTYATYAGHMQCGPDGKIYIARGQNLAGPQSSIGVINNPNAAGFGCNYVDLGQSVAPASSQYGLPQMLNNRILGSITHSSACRSYSFSVPPAIKSAFTACAGFAWSALLWNFGGPATGSSNFSLQENPKHIYSAPGTFTVKLIVYYSCGANNDTLSQTVTVSPDPSLTVSGNINLCHGDSTVLNASGANNYTWTSPTSMTATASISLTPLSSTEYTLSGTSTVTGCSAANVVSITVNPLPSISISGKLNVCSAENTVLTGIGADTYTWTTPTSMTAAASISVIPVSSAVYTLSGTNTLTGCASTETVLITVVASPSIIIKGKVSTCPGENTILTGSGADTYTWTTPTSMTTVASISILPTGSTVYTLSGTSTLTGCTSTETILVTLLANPSLTITGKVNVCAGEKTDLTGAGSDTYTWTTPSGKTVAPTLSVSPNNSATYTLAGTNTLTGCAASTTVSLSVIKCTGLSEQAKEEVLKVYPNPASRVITIEATVSVKLIICNELGSVVYENAFETGKHDIDISDFAHSLYFIRVLDEKTACCTKFIKLDH